MLMNHIYHYSHSVFWELICYNRFMCNVLITRRVLFYFTELPFLNNALPILEDVYIGRIWALTERADKTDPFSCI